MGSVQTPLFNFLGEIRVTTLRFSRRTERDIFLTYLDLGEVKEIRIPREVFKLSSNLNKITAVGHSAGHYMVEHTSPNPVGKLHVGRTRGTFLGHFYYNFFKFLGLKVDEAVLFNDLTVNVACGLEGYLKEGSFDQYRKYHALLTESPEFKLQMDERIKTNFQGVSEQRAEYSEYWASVLLGEIEELIGVKPEKIYDSVIEQKEGFQAVVQKAEATFETSPEGILFFTNSKGDKRYLKNKVGIPNYILRDIAIDILNPEIKRITIAGEDHESYLEDRREMIHILGHGVPDSMVYKMVFSEGAKISTRRGTAVSVKDFLSRISTEIPDAKGIENLCFQLAILLKSASKKMGLEFTPSEYSSIIAFLKFILKEPEFEGGRVVWDEENDQVNDYFIDFTLLIHKQIWKNNPASYVKEVLSMGNFYAKKLSGIEREKFRDFMRWVYKATIRSTLD